MFCLTFITGIGMVELTERASQCPDTVGAPDVLNFLLNHAAKLNMELAGLPGGPSPAPPTGEILEG